MDGFMHIDIAIDAYIEYSLYITLIFHIIYKYNDDELVYIRIIIRIH